jgi:hypothetical protein
MPLMHPLHSRGRAGAVATADSCNDRTLSQSAAGAAPGSWQRDTLIALPAVASLVVIYCYYFSYYAHYSVFADDLSVIVGSLNSPLEWFTSGFSRYFVVYPEWSSGSTDFFRPCVNFIIRLENDLFGNRFWLYFAVLYAAQLVMCLLVLDSLRVAGVPPRTRSMFGLLAAVNPAFLGVAVQNVSFQFDIWCGLLAFASFCLIMNERYWLACICMCASVFTKEAALYVPVAAGITVYLRTRRVAPAGSMLIPLVAWLVVREFVFVGSLGNIYALHLSLFGVLKMIKGVLVWPTGVVDPLALREILDQHSIGSHLVDVILMVANQLLWIILIFGAVRVSRGLPAATTGMSATTAGVPPTNLPLIVLLWLAGALSFGVLVGHEARFGGLIYPFEIVLFALMIGQPAAVNLRLPGRAAVAILMLAFAVNASALLRHQDTEPYVTKQLLAAIRAQPPETTVIYVLSAPKWVPNPDSVAAMAGSRARVVILSQFEGCVTAAGGTAGFGASSATLSVRLQLPACATVTLGSVPPSTLARGVQGVLRRATFASYQFPEGRVVSVASAMGGEPTVILGRELELTFDPVRSGRYVLLYYDWSIGSYRRAEL